MIANVIPHVFIGLGTAVLFLPPLFLCQDEQQQQKTTTATETANKNSTRNNDDEIYKACLNECGNSPALFESIQPKQRTKSNVSFKKLADATHISIPLPQLKEKSTIFPLDFLKLIRLKSNRITSKSREVHCLASGHPPNRPGEN
jgi:hypothetical protein